MKILLNIRHVFGALALAVVLMILGEAMGLRALLRSGGTAQATSVIPAMSDAGQPISGETYLWRPVAIGGGGSVTGFAADPAGKTRLVRTDVYGAYIWREDMDRWLQLVAASAMPQQDRWRGGLAEGVYEVAVAPGDANRLYMGLRGRVYRSDNRGSSWTRPDADAPFRFSPNGPYRFRGAFIAVSPHNPDLLLMGTEAQGLWRSADGALQWQRVASVPPSKANGEAGAPPLPLWVAPPRGGRSDFYVFSAGNGLYRSSDDGKTFARIGQGQSSAPNDIARGAFASNGDFYAVSDTDRSVYVMRDGRWRNLVAENRVNAASFVGVTVDAQSGRIIVVDDGGKAYISVDGGESWSRLGRSVQAGEGEPPWLRVNNISYFATGGIFFDPVVKDRLWAMTGTGPYYADCVDTCGKLAWISAVRGIEELVASDVIQAPGRAPLFAALDFGIHLKENLGAFSDKYGPAERVLIAAQQIAWTPANPDFLVTNASDTRTFCCSQDGNAVMAGYSTDGGRNWHKFATLPQPPGTRGDDPWRMAFGTIAVAADNQDNIIWVPGYDRAPFYTLDRGLTWHKVSFPGETGDLTGSYPSIWVQRKTLAADRVLPGTFYFYHSGTASNPSLLGLWRTHDGGRSWEQAYKGELAPRSGIAAKLRAVPGQAGHLFFTSGQPGQGAPLMRSTDGGGRWSAVPSITHVDDIAFGKAAKGRAYPTAFISGEVDGKYGIWRSIDALATWQRVSDFPLDRLDQVVVMDADKDIFGRVYLGMMGSGWVYGEPASCTSVESRASDQKCRAVE